MLRPQLLSPRQEVPMRCSCIVIPVLFSLLAAGSSPQTQIMTRTHSCEGEYTEGLPTCQRAWRSNISAVFLGRAIDVREEDVPILIDGKKALTEKLYATFRVKEAFVGISSNIVNVVSGGDLCGFPFSRGHNYLVYGRRLPSGEVYVSISSSTKVEKDAAEDLKYFRGLASAPHGATIYGTMLRYTAPQSPRVMVRLGTPEAGHEIGIQGTERTYKVVVDTRGRFSLSGLPPGRYTVLPNADGEVHTSPPTSMTVDVVDRGCAQFDFWIDPFVRKPSKPSE